MPPSVGVLTHGLIAHRRSLPALAVVRAIIFPCFLGVLPAAANFVAASSAVPLG